MFSSTVTVRSVFDKYIREMVLVGLPAGSHVSWAGAAPKRCRGGAARAPLGSGELKGIVWSEKAVWG